jgi:hypothetical protein
MEGAIPSLLVHFCRSRKKETHRDECATPRAEEGADAHGLSGVDELEMNARIGEILKRWLAVGWALGVVGNRSLEFLDAESADPSRTWGPRWFGGRRRIAADTLGPAQLSRTSYRIRDRRPLLPAAWPRSLGPEGGMCDGDR